MFIFVKKTKPMKNLLKIFIALIVVVSCTKIIKNVKISDKSNLNGITITGSGTGRITPFSTSVPVPVTCETNLITFTNTVELGDDSPPYTGPTNFIYTMTFSSPVNNLLIHLIFNMLN